MSYIVFNSKQAFGYKLRVKYAWQASLVCHVLTYLTDNFHDFAEAGIFAEWQP